MGRASLLSADSPRYIPREIEVESVDWDAFKRDEFAWEQGEHVTIAGPTGQGKTTLGLNVLDKRTYVAVLGTKPRDTTLSTFAAQNGYKVMREWNPIPTMYPRVVFWPKIDHATKMREQRDHFAGMLQNIYRTGNWTVYIDELDYVCNYLRLAPLVELLWRHGRSLGISVIGGTQRPAFIPLLAYDQASHLFISRDNDDVNVKRYARLGGASRKAIERILPRLPKHSFLYLSTRREGMLQTRVTL
jgi:hypothetical protein